MQQGFDSKGYAMSPEAHLHTRHLSLPGLCPTYEAHGEYTLPADFSRRYTLSPRRRGKPAPLHWPQTQRFSPCRLTHEGFQPEYPGYIGPGPITTLPGAALPLSYTGRATYQN